MLLAHRTRWRQLLGLLARHVIPSQLQGSLLNAMEVLRTLELTGAHRSGLVPRVRGTTLAALATHEKRKIEGIEGSQGPMKD